MNTNKILIIGKHGNLGGYVLDVFKDEKPKAVGQEELDVTGEDQVIDVIEKVRPSLVINCTAYNAVDKAEEDLGTAESVNGYGVGFIAKACKTVDATLVHYSSGMVFDGSNSSGYKEDDQTHPVNAYGMSKLMGEMEVQKNLDKYYIIRTCWLYGKQGTGTDNKKSFSEIMLEMALADKSIDAVDDEFGSPTFMLDLAQATRALVETKKPYGIYHLTNAGSCSRYDWASEIFKIKEINARLASVHGDHFTRAAKRPKYEILNNTKFIELRPWTEALGEYLKDLK